MVWFVAPAVVFLAGLSLLPLAVLVRMAVSDVEPSHLLGGWRLAADRTGQLRTGPDLR